MSVRPGARASKFAWLNLALTKAWLMAAGRIGRGAPQRDDTHVDTGEISIRVVRESSQATVTVTGRVTVDSSPHLRSMLLELLRRGSAALVVIDVSGVSYLDMSGLASLLEALKAARQRSVVLRVLGMTGQSRMMAEVAELDHVFRAAGSELELR